jgi:hypothetical protein
MRRIGALMPFKEQDAQGQEIVAALRQGLSDRGWTEGRNLEIIFRWIGDGIERRSAYAAEIVAASPDVIFACYAAQLAPLARETSTIPIVLCNSRQSTRNHRAPHDTRPRRRGDRMM